MYKIPHYVYILPRNNTSLTIKLCKTCFKPWLAFKFWFTLKNWVRCIKQRNPQIEYQENNFLVKLDSTHAVTTDLHTSQSVIVSTWCIKCVSGSICLVWWSRWNQNLFILNKTKHAESIHPEQDQGELMKENYTENCDVTQGW